MRPPREHGCAFVPCPAPAVLDDILCEHRERTVGQDNCVQYKGLTLQVPADRHHYHYIKVKVLEYPGESLSIHHGPQELARHDNHGQSVARYAHAAAQCPPRAATPQGSDRQWQTIYLLPNRTVLFARNTTNFPDSGMESKKTDQYTEGNLPYGLVCVSNLTGGSR